PDARSPISYPVDVRTFTAAVQRPSVKGLRVAWSADLGVTPVDAEIAQICVAATGVFRRLGARVDTAHPDFDGVVGVINASRGLRMVAADEDRLPNWRDVMQTSLGGNVDAALPLTASDTAGAEKHRPELWRRVRASLPRYDVILTPPAPIPPFPVEVTHPTEINGRPMANYIQWGLLTYA